MDRISVVCTWIIVMLLCSCDSSKIASVSVVTPPVVAPEAPAVVCGNPVPGAPTLHVYGDSMTFACGSWAQRFAKDYGLNLVQHSLGSTNILSPNQAPALLSDAFKPGDTVAFAPGVNDAASNFGEGHRALFRQKLTDIVNRLNDLGVNVYIGTNTHYDPDNAHTAQLAILYNDEMMIYAGITRDVMRNQKLAHLIDFSSCFTPHGDNTNDGLHPSTLGQEQMYQCFKNDTGL